LLFSFKEEGTPRSNSDPTSTGFGYNSEPIEVNR